MNSKAAFTTIRTTASGCFKEVDMGLTMTEKRDLLERIREMVLNDVLNREDRDDILRICIAACDRELAKIKEDRNV